MQRRDFLTSAAATALLSANVLARGQSEDAQPAQPLLTAADSAPAAKRIPRVSSAGAMRGEMLYRQLGSTGIEVSVIGMGGSHLGRATVSEGEAIRLIHEGLDRGINFLDNSWDYNEGRSEERVGQALAQGGYRQKAFVMTKIDGRTKEIATNQIDDSLRRLKVDHIDLLQHHEILRYDDPNRIFNEGGSMEAVAAAKQAGKVRFIGFTGHKDPHIHLYMMNVAQQNGFHFDTVQMPLNIMDAHFRSFSQLVVPQALKQGIGVLGMKCFGDGIILKSGVVEPMECLHYSLNLPLSVLITGINTSDLLNQAFAAVKSFRPMDESQVSALISKSQAEALNGKFELFKTSSHFDTTARHPDWLGSDSPAVQKLAPELPG
jgi:aryl-alcohol dehydrogenase-like predicted oxidoreductase